MGIVTDVGLPIALAVIMFALGLGLTFDDFARVAARPRDFLVGAVSQVVLLPIVAFVLVVLWSPPPEIALGVMIIAAAPGGVTSNLLTAFGRGDVALSISLTAAISLLCVVTIPLVVVLSHAHFVGGGDAGDLSIGAHGARRVPDRDRARPVGPRPAPAGRGLRRPLRARGAPALGRPLRARPGRRDLPGARPYRGISRAGRPIALALNLAMMALALRPGPVPGLRAAPACRHRHRVRLQNGTLAIAVASVLFGGGLVAVPAATYSLIMFATALVFIAYLRRRGPGAP